MADNKDAEKTNVSPTTTHQSGQDQEVPVTLPQYSAGDNAPDPGEYVQPRDEESYWTRNGLTLDSFKRRRAGTQVVQLDKSMKKRHLNMIGIGGAMGAGFYVGSGKVLAQGGPGFMLIDFMIIGMMIFNVVFALGELAIMYPVSGGFYTYSTRFIDPSWGFAMGWNYVLQWFIVLPLELTVCAITIDYWEPGVSQAVWITIFFVAIIIVNIFGTLGYAEEEFITASFRLGSTIVFMIIALVLVCGGGPADGRYHEYWGARYWYDPGAFKNGFVGFCSVFVTAAFSFSGTELVGLAAAEAKNPTKALPQAIKQVFWRIILFYVLGLFFVGLLVPNDDTNLLTGGGSNTSPFVLAALYAGLKGFDSFLNVVILVSVVSIGVSAVYASSRTLTALAEQGYAPKVFMFIDRSGRPLYSVGITLLFGPLAYIALSSSGETVFIWLQALSGLSALFTWGSICLSHIRFRKAWAYNGRSVEEIPFRAVFGVWGSWFGLFLCVIVLMASFYDAIHNLDVEIFFQRYMAAPIVLAFWVGGFLWKRAGWLRVSQIDIMAGLRDHDWEEIKANKLEKASWPVWRRVIDKVW